MNIANKQLPGPPSGDELAAYKAKAQNAYNMSKKAAAEAVANIYILWKEAGSAQANDLCYEWLKKELEAFGAAITQNNKDAGSDSSLEMQVSIGAIEREVTFAQIIKYVFDLKKPNDASTVSRYAKVMEHIQRHEDLLHSNDVDAITTFIEQRGGFEAVLHEARQADDPAQQTFTPVVVSHYLRALLAKAPSIDQVAINDNFASDELIVLLGRPDANKIDVLSKFNLGAEEIDDLLEKIDPKILGGAQPLTRFMQQVCCLAEAVPEGRNGVYTVDGTKAGKLHKQERAYCLLLNSDKSASLVVSSRYVNESVAIEAKPTHKALVQKGQSKPLMLSRADSHQIESLLKSPLCSRTQNLDAKIESGSYKWSLTPVVGSSTPTHEWCWAQIEEHSPVRPVRPAYELKVQLDVAEICELVVKLEGYKQSLSKDGKNTADGHFGITRDPPTVSIAIEPKSAGVAMLKLWCCETGDSTVVDFSAFLKVLTQIALCASDTVNVSYTHDGLVWVEFSDEFGVYTTYLPAVSKKQKRSNAKGSNSSFFKKVDMT